MNYQRLKVANQSVKEENGQDQFEDHIEGQFENQVEDFFEHQAKDQSEDLFEDYVDTENTRTSKLVNFKR